MGKQASKPKQVPQLKQSEIQEFSRQSLFPEKTVEQLYYYFYKFSSSERDDGVIDYSEFCLNLRNASTSLVAERIFKMFDTNDDGVINFREFLLGLSTFMEEKEKSEESETLRTSLLKQQIDVSFRMLDTKNSGKVHTKDIKRMLESGIRQNTGLNLNLTQIEAIIEKTFETLSYKSDSEGEYITKNEYQKLVLSNPNMLKWLSADLQRVQNGIQPQFKAKKSRCI